MIKKEVSNSRFTLIIMVIILLVLTPVGIVVDKKIEAYFENKREP